MNGTQTNNLTYSGIFIGDYRELNIINPNLIPSKKRISRKRFLYKSFFSYYQRISIKRPFFDLCYNTDRSLTSFIEENDFDAVFLMDNGTTIYDVMYDFDFSLSK